MDVSIIVPLFQGMKYVPDILNYIKENYEFLSGRIECECELILVNDSPDQKIDNSMVNDCKCMPVFIINNHANQGIHYSRYRGLQNAKGEYILFLDQDDYIKKEYVYSQLVKIGNADVVICNGFYRKDRLIMPDDRVKERVRSREDYFYTMNSIISPGQALIRRESIPLEWEQNILKSNYCDDAFLWLLLKDRGKTFEINDDVLFYHKEDGENTSFKWKNNAQALMELYQVIEQNNLIQNEHLLTLKETIDHRVKKHLQYAELEELLENVEKKRSILKEYFIEKNYFRIAIYGYGVFGRKFVGLLKTIGIEVLYAVDQNADAIKADDIQLKTLEDKLEEVDIVIVTTVWIYDDIHRKLRERVPYKTVSLRDVLGDLT